MSEFEEMDISDLSDEMLDKMNEMIESFGEDELQIRPRGTGYSRRLAESLAYISFRP